MEKNNNSIPSIPLKNCSLDNKDSLSPSMELSQLEKSILKFLVSGKVYSVGAIQKNFGISDTELDIVYENLLKHGYLESYSDFENRNSTITSHCSSKECHNCSSGCSNELEFSKDKILVLTEKSINMF